MSRDHLHTLLSILIGALAWLLVSALSGYREAWDSDLYFAIVMPAAILSAIIFGYLSPRFPWRWGLYPFVGQFIVVLVLLGFGNGLSFVFFTFLIIAIVPMYAAKLGATARHFLLARAAKNGDSKAIRSDLP